MVYLGLDCFLCALGCYFAGYGLVVYISGRYARGLVVFGAVVCIRLVGPWSLKLDNLACLCYSKVP